MLIPADGETCLIKQCGRARHIPSLSDVCLGAEPHLRSAPCVTEEELPLRVPHGELTLDTVVGEAEPIVGHDSDLVEAACFCRGCCARDVVALRDVELAIEDVERQPERRRGDFEQDGEIRGIRRRANAGRVAPGTVRLARQHVDRAAVLFHVVGDFVRVQRHLRGRGQSRAAGVQEQGPRLPVVWRVAHDVQQLTAHRLRTVHEEERRRDRVSAEVRVDLDEGRSVPLHRIQGTLERRRGGVLPSIGVDRPVKVAFEVEQVVTTVVVAAVGIEKRPVGSIVGRARDVL